MGLRIPALFQSSNCGVDPDSWGQGPTRVEGELPTGSVAADQLLPQPSQNRTTGVTKSGSSEFTRDRRERDTDCDEFGHGANPPS
jgi:hypothetical protein